MSPAFDIDALLPSDDERDERRRALVAELAAGTAAAAPRDPSARRPAAGVPGPAASRGATRRGFVRGGLALTGAAAGGLAVTGAFPGLRGSGVDVVAAARAAAAAPVGGILHTVVRYEQGSRSSMAFVGSEAGSARETPEVVGQLNGRSETWAAESPARQRQVLYVDLAGSEREGRMETSWGPHEWRWRNSWEDVVKAWDPTPGKYAEWRRARRRESRRLTVGFSAGSDPVGTIRALLASDRLAVAGSRTLAGRTVTRLTGRDLGRKRATGRPTPPVDYEYLVDAETFVPVRITSAYVIPARPGSEEPAARRDRRIVTRWVFERFERLPLTDENERLLAVDTTGLRVVDWYGRTTSLPRRSVGRGR